ncbi:MAG: hypothetical protein NTV01_00440 [Bacteroidia bacterium]|nr:hypothetical protein [Bacteroidia bacterium]
MHKLFEKFLNEVLDICKADLTVHTTENLVAELYRRFPVQEIGEEISEDSNEVISL